MRIIPLSVKLKRLCFSDRRNALNILKQEGSVIMATKVDDVLLKEYNAAMKEEELNQATKQVVIVSLPSRVKKDNVFRIADGSRDLRNAILEYKQKLKNSIVVEDFHNIIVTKTGYYLALWNTDMSAVRHPEIIKDLKRK